MLERLRSETARMAGLVEQAVEDAVTALSRGDLDLARRTVALDEQIDAAEIEVEKTAIDFLSLFHPAAGEFRLALMVIKVNNELERAADCAGNVAERVVALATEAEAAGKTYRVPGELSELGAAVSDLVRRTVRAYNFRDAKAAEAVIVGDAAADALYFRVLQNAMVHLDGSDAGHATDGLRPGDDLTHVMIAKNLERIGDHCTNVAEDIVYIDRGQIVRHRSAV